LISHQPGCHGYWPLDESSFRWAWSTIAICQAQGITKIRVSTHCAKPQTPGQLTSLANPFEPYRRPLYDTRKGYSRRRSNPSRKRYEYGEGPRWHILQQATFAAETLRVLLLPPSQHPQGYQPELGDFRRRSKDNPGVGVKNVGARRSV
jgi:hypothetical protein